MHVKKAIYLTLLMLPLIAEAGGSYYPITITSFTHNKYEFHFTAKASEERKWMDQECKEIEVSGEYDTLKWIGYKRPMNKDNHMQAIKYLANSAKNNKEILFGYIGSGLHKEKSCTYKSRGLIYSDYDKVFVMSLYGSI